MHDLGKSWLAALSPSHIMKMKPAMRRPVRLIDDLQE